MKCGAGLLAVLLLGKVLMDCVNPALAEAQDMECCRLMACAPSMTTPLSCCKTTESSHAVFLLQRPPQVQRVTPTARLLSATLRAHLGHSVRVVKPHGLAPPGAASAIFPPLRV